MLETICTMTILCCPLCTQADIQSNLGSADIALLKALALDWVAAETELNPSPGSHSQRLSQAKRRFMDAMQAAGGQSKILGNVNNLLKVFESVFPYDRQVTTGEVVEKRIEPIAPYPWMDALPSMVYHLVAPKNYMPSVHHRTVLMLRSSGPYGQHNETVVKDFELRWGGTASRADTLFVIPELGSPSHGRVTDADNWDEPPLLRRALAPLGEVQRAFRVDRRRKVLDCGPDTSDIGIRLAAFFPTQFAGLILRGPVSVDDLHLGALAAMPVLLVATDATIGEFSVLRERLASVPGAGEVTLLNTRDYSSTAAGAIAIDSWTRRQRRQAFPREVTVVLNHDCCRRAYWAGIVRAEPVDSTSPEDRPILRVRADSVANRVYIESHNVREAYVLLNDALVDLEKPVTFVVNGVAHNQLFSRSVETVFEYLIRYYDCTALYSVRYQFLLPRQPSAPNDLARGGRSPRTSVKFPPEAVSSVEDPVNPRSVIPWETLAVATGLGCVMIVIVVMIYRRRRGSSRTIG